MCTSGQSEVRRWYLKIQESKSKEQSARWVGESPLIRADMLTFGRKRVRSHFVLKWCVVLCSSKTLQGDQSATQKLLVGETINIAKSIAREHLFFIYSYN